MEIAVVNSFPRHPGTPQLELIRRFATACASTGHRTIEVETSDEILQSRPDFVLAIHPVTPKLTPYFTVGAIWMPPIQYLETPKWMRSVRSYDGYLMSSKASHHFLDILEQTTGTRKPRSDFDFPSGSPKLPRKSINNQDLSLFYVGSEHLGIKESALIHELDEKSLINIYGPGERWSSYSNSFRGSTPLDDYAGQETLAKHGIALCLHSEIQKNEDFASIRLLESAAAGCLLIVNELPSTRRLFGDSVFYIDIRLDIQETSWAITRIIEWANLNSAAATQMREMSNLIFSKNCSLEKVIQKTCDFVAHSKEKCALENRNAAEWHQKICNQESAGALPLIDVIMRTGGRDIEHIKRAIASLNAQTEGTYRVLLVDYKDRSDIKALSLIIKTDRVQIKYINCEDTGARSTSLWAGLNQVEAPFFANLDDDDTVAPDHFAGLLNTAFAYADHDLYYAGTVRIEEAPGYYVASENFNGPIPGEVKECRELVFLEPYNLARLIATDNYITSNAFIARSSALDARTLLDPHLIVGEDMYLLLMLARRRAFRCNSRPTLNWHWRSNSDDNSMIGIEQTVWQTQGAALLMRLNQEVFPGSLTFGALRVIAQPGEEGPWKPPTPANKVATAK